MSDRTEFHFHKSSYSGAQGECVEVAVNVPALAAVRDSKDTGGPALVFTADAWRVFVAGVRGRSETRSSICFVPSR